MKSKFRPAISLLSWGSGRAYKRLNRFLSAKRNSRLRRRCLSVAENGEVEFAEAVGVGAGFDFNDFSVCDGEAKHHGEASAWGYDNSDCSVYECWLCCASA